MGSDDAGFCPTCYERSGPLTAHGLTYFWCMPHRLRWTVPARARDDSAEAVAGARLVCQKTVLIPYARSWRPDQGL
jgi:hypothetical protein